MDEKGLIRYTRTHLRELGIIGYFRELGIIEDELSFVNEFTIRVGKAAILVGENINASHQRERILAGDILVSLNGKPLAVIEIKAPTRSLTDSSEQAISFARLLPEVAPYAIVTNGKDFLVYDTFTKELLKTPTDSSAMHYIHYIDDWVTRDKAISELTNSFTSSSDQSDKKNI